MSLSTASASSLGRPGGGLTKDMDSIRERRIRLQEIIRAMQPPTLTSNPSSLITRNPRRLWDKPLLSTSSSSTTPDLQPPRHHRPSNFRPSDQLLPDIMKREGSSQSTPEASRQPTPFSRRPYETRKSRQVMSEDDRSDEDAEYTQETLEEIVRGIKSNSRRRRLDSTIRARKLLSIEVGPPIKEFLKAGILRPLIPHVQQREDSTLQLEATWALTNLASGTVAHTAAVVDGGAVPVLIEALAGGDEKVAEQAAWALGNIAGEERYRNQVVSAGVVTPLLAALHHRRASSPTSTSSSSSSSSSSSPVSSPESLVRVVVWVLANIFRHKGLVMEQQEREACVAALKTLLTHTDSEVTVDALWAVSYIAAGDEEGQREVVAADILPDLVTHLGAKERQKVIPALRATGNLVMGSDDQTDAVLAAGVLPYYNRLLVSPHHNLRREVSWALSNITAGTRGQIQQVIDGGLLPHLVEVIGQNYLDVQREAAWALSNLTTGGSPEQLGRLLLAGGVSALTSVLVVSEIATVGVALSSLQKILKAPDLRDEAVRQVRVAQGVQRLEALQGYVDSDIKERATEILETYFQDNTEGGDERT